VTATGTATVDGSGKAARDQAIRNAVSDARDQATVAAQAAGGRLGTVLGIQISSYPVAVSLAGVSHGGVIEPACPPTSTCPTPVPPRSVTATVTVTWALA
jgi:uncharacterized protein YggE